MRTEKKILVRRNFRAVEFSHILKLLGTDPFKIVNKPSEVTYNFLTRERKTFHTHRNHSIQNYSEELLLFPHIQYYNEQNPKTIHVSDKPNIIQNDLYTSNVNYAIDDNVFDDDLFCSNEDDQPILYDTDLCISTKLNDNHYDHPRSKSDSDSLQYDPRSSNIQSINKLPGLFDLPDTETIHDSPTPFANESNCSLPFNQSQISNRNTRTKYDLRLLPVKIYYLFLPSHSSPDK